MFVGTGAWNFQFGVFSLDFCTHAKSSGRGEFGCVSFHEYCGQIVSNISDLRELRLLFFVIERRLVTAWTHILQVSIFAFILVYMES